MHSSTFFMGHIIQGESESCEALVRRLRSLLTTRCSVSGRLPYTIAKAESDYPAQINTNSSSAIIQIPYNEGLFIDYRHFDAVGDKASVHEDVPNNGAGRHCSTLRVRIWTVVHDVRVSRSLNQRNDHTWEPEDRFWSLRGS